MKVILKKDMEKLGKVGEIVKVAPVMAEFSHSAANRDRGDARQHEDHGNRAPGSRAARPS